MGLIASVKQHRHINIANAWRIYIWIHINISNRSILIRISYTIHYSFM
jgi:hypothetical protein